MQLSGDETQWVLQQLQSLEEKKKIAEEKKAERQRILDLQKQQRSQEKLAG